VVLDEKFRRAKIIPGYKKVAEMEMILNYFGDNSYTEVAWEQYRQVFIGKKLLPLLLKKNTELFLPF